MSFNKLFLVFTFSFFMVSSYGQGITLILDGKSEYKIVISDKPSDNEKIAADILQDYLFKISGCKIEIINHLSKKSKKEIIIGNTNRIVNNPNSNLKILGSSGFVIQTMENNLLIKGGTGKGIIYGVTGFLEDVLGVRKYAPGSEYIPHNETVIIPNLNDIQVPPSEIRIVQCEFTDDPMYSYFRKIESIKDIWDDGSYHGYFVHTLPQILPSEKYFKNHPEYYAMVNGQRVPYGQYCLSNPDLVKIVIEDLRKQMTEHPKLKYWSVSQSDNYYKCECDKCAKIDEDEGSPSGLMLQFVNQVAKAFPDKIITTLAYQYTRRPPLKTKPLPNVLVTLCTIELNRSKPIQSDYQSEEFVWELDEWSKITDNLMIWDYETQFTHSLAPFPLYNTLQPNLQLFTQKNVVAHFQQCNAKHSENFSELKSYLLSKLLWDPDADQNEIIDDFMNGFYGNAAPFLRKYFDILHQEMKKADINLDIYSNPVWLANNVLSEQNIDNYNKLFDQAEASVKGDTILYNRVRAARLPVMYSKLEIAKTDLFGERGWYINDYGNYIIKEDMNKLLNDFYYICKHDSIRALNEKGLTPDDYYKSTQRAIDVQIAGNLAFNKNVVCDPIPDARYTGLGEMMLTNGVRGSEDYKINWLGWEGLDIEITVDLEEIFQPNDISISTLHFPEVWILHPDYITCSYSIDGINYKELGKVFSDKELKYKFDISNFRFSNKDQKFRYLKFFVKSMKTLPEWHTYKTNQAWVFIDEITVK